MVTSIMCALLAVSVVSLVDWTVGVLDAPVVTTRYGKVRGFYVDNVAIYYGVPFASPPVGSLMYVLGTCLLYTSPSPRDQLSSRMPSSA